VRKPLRIKDAFSHSWLNLGEVWAGADEAAGPRTGSEVCRGRSLLTDIRHYIMGVNGIIYR
jgi:hypothetical protein